jgi:hypothetical protein
LLAGTPSRIAAWATAAPWLPPDAAATPQDGIGWVSRFANAPCALNERECCRHSSFSARSLASPAEIR